MVGETRWGAGVTGLFLKWNGPRETPAGQASHRRSSQEGSQGRGLYLVLWVLETKSVFGVFRLYNEKINDKNQLALPQPFTMSSALGLTSLAPHGPYRHPYSQI